MIELSPEQVQAIEQGEPLPVVVNPKTHEEFVLLRKKRYEAMQKWIAPSEAALGRSRRRRPDRAAS